MKIKGNKVQMMGREDLALKVPIMAGLRLRA
jgi:hypothetical protein